MFISKNSVLWVAINTKKDRNRPKRHRILKDREDTEKYYNDTENNTYTYLIPERRLVHVFFSISLLSVSVSFRTLWVKFFDLFI